MKIADLPVHSPGHCRPSLATVRPGVPPLLPPAAVAVRVGAAPGTASGRMRLHLGPRRAGARLCCRLSVGGHTALVSVGRQPLALHLREQSSQQRARQGATRQTGPPVLKRSWASPEVKTRCNQSASRLTTAMLRHSACVAAMLTTCSWQLQLEGQACLVRVGNT